MKPINVGLLGIGTVGGGTFTVLKRNEEEITRRAGRPIRITAVAEEPAPDLAAPAPSVTPASGVAATPQASRAPGSLPATPSPAAKAARHGAAAGDHA